jgi:hypothetical protein
MFNLCQLRLQMLIPLAKCLFKFGYEVHVFSWSVPKCSVTLAEASKRYKAIVAKPTAALLTLETTPYIADSRYLHGVCGVSDWKRRNMQETAKMPVDFRRQL